MDASVGASTCGMSRYHSVPCLGSPNAAHRSTCETHGWKQQRNGHEALGEVNAHNNRRCRKDIAGVARAHGSGGGGVESGEVDDGSGGSGHRRVAPGGGNPRSRTFRFWIDYQAFSGRGSAELIERALRAAGGVRAGGPPKTDEQTGAKRDDGIYGYMHMDAWDLLWSVTAKAALAADLLRPHQMLAIVPGLLAVSRKTTLVRSLRDTFGEAAWRVVPRSFKLPDELDEWVLWVAAHPGQDTGLWMLKNNKQRGTGLRLVRTADAFRACFETTCRPDLPPGLRLYRWYLAQQYVARPLLIDGRKFGVRVWVLVSDVAPLRLYMYGRGLVLFSSHRYDAELLSAEDADTEGGANDGGRRGGGGGQFEGGGGRERGRDGYAGGEGAPPPPGHVTNYAQNEDGQVWSLAQLAAHMGAAAFGKLWQGMCASTAAAFASALPRCAQVMSSVRPPPHACFQFFGLDYLVDEAGRPWLLEVNATPSMKVEHTDPRVASLIHSQKWPAVRDMVTLLGLGPERFREGHRAPDRSSPAYAQEELRRRGGFIPLLHLLPHPTTSATPEAAAAAGLLQPLPWTRADRALRDWCRTSREYQVAAAEVPAAAAAAAAAMETAAATVVAAAGGRA